MSERLGSDLCDIQWGNRRGVYRYNLRDGISLDHWSRHLR